MTAAIGGITRPGLVRAANEGFYTVTGNGSHCLRFPLNANPALFRGPRTNNSTIRTPTKGMLFVVFVKTTKYS